MKARALSTAVAAVIAALAALPDTALAQQAPVVNDIVLRINDRIATRYDYESRRAELERELLRGDLPLAERRELARMLPERVFADLYQEALLLSRADQLGVVFTEEEVEAQLAAMQERHGFASREEFEAALAQSGLSLRDFREQLRRNMRMQDVVGREVRSRIGVDDEIARIYYRDHPERFTEPLGLRIQELIVLEREGQSAAERQELAAAIRRELAAGSALADLVATYRDRGLTSDLIEHGWVGPGDLAPELQEAVWALPAGSFSEPVASRGGLHILEVVERREAGLRTFAEVAERARDEAFQEAFAEEMASYLDELEEQAFIQLDPPPGAEGFRRAAPAEALGGLEAVEPASEPVAAPEEPTAPPAGSDDGGR